jgi:hypothetical protein
MGDGEHGLGRLYRTPPALRRKDYTGIGEALLDPGNFSGGGGLIHGVATPDCFPL